MAPVKNVGEGVAGSYVCLLRTTLKMRKVHGADVTGTVAWVTSAFRYSNFSPARGPTASNPQIPMGYAQRQPEPEIIPPRKSRSGLSDEHLDQLASLLDDMFQIPGTGIRFGLDPIIGLIPGLGDLISGAMSFLIVFAAWQRGLPRITILRMMTNIGIDTLVGTIPIVGDAFDAAWKSNRMNFRLLTESTAAAQHGRSRTFHDWLFFALLLFGAFILIASPIVALAFIVHWLRS